MFSKFGGVRSGGSLWASLIVFFVGLGAVAEASAQEGVPERGEEEARTGYDGGFFIESDDEDYRVRFGGRVQTQLRAYLTDDGERELTELDLDIRRARFKVDGHAFGDRLTYQLQPEFAGSSVQLLDFFVNYELVPGAAEVKVGKWRYPFLRQEITSSGSLLLVDRSIVGSTFGDGFDTGVMFHNGYKSSPTFEWLVGAFHGDTSQLGGVNYEEDIMGPSIVARGAYNYGDVAGYREADVEKGPLRFSLGAAVSAQPGIERTFHSELKATVDVMLKAHGFSTSGAVVMGSTQDGSSMGDRNLAATGYFLQAGYLVGDFVEPAARYSLVDFDDLGLQRHEGMGGINLYFYGHKLKWQTDAGVIIDEAADVSRTSYQARTQLQFAF